MYDKKYILEHFGLQTCTNTEILTVKKTVDNCAHAEYSILAHLQRNSLYMQNNNA